MSWPGGPWSRRCHLRPKRWFPTPGGATGFDGCLAVAVEVGFTRKVLDDLYSGGGRRTGIGHRADVRDDTFATDDAMVAIGLGDVLQGRRWRRREGQTGGMKALGLTVVLPASGGQQRAS
jgi:hypothetical protein